MATKKANPFGKRPPENSKADKALDRKGGDGDADDRKKKAKKGFVPFAKRK